MNVQIIEYDRGDAFKRWLLPGWGATVLAIECELIDPDDQEVVGRAFARRTVSMGGGYTIGAWRTIIGQVAEDIAKELRAPDKATDVYRPGARSAFRYTPPDARR